MLDTKQICRDFLGEIGLKFTFNTQIKANQIPADYITDDDNFWYIVELKQGILDCEKAIPQLLRYYNLLTRYEYYKRYKHPIKLYVFYIGIVDKDRFLDYAKIYRDYIANPKCPSIEFYYRNDEDKLEKA